MTVSTSFTIFIRLLLVALVGCMIATTIHLDTPDTFKLNQLQQSLDMTNIQVQQNSDDIKVIKQQILLSSK